MKPGCKVSACEGTRAAVWTVSDRGSVLSAPCHGGMLCGSLSSRGARSLRLKGRLGREGAKVGRRTSLARYRACSQAWLEPIYNP